jgi:hypothetical protein
MKAIEITLPQTLQDCTPDMMAKWLMIAPVFEESKNDLSASLDFQCQLISIFSGLSVNKVRKAHVDDVLQCTRYILDMLATYKQKEIPTGRVDIDGKAYVFTPDISVMSTGQVIDLKLIESVQEDPCAALAICYIEEGMEYAQEDDRGKVLNPSAKRREIFKQSFPGDEFIDFFAFFLQQSEVRKLAILGIQLMRAKEQTKILKETTQAQMKEMTANGSSGQDSFFTWLRSFKRMWTKLRGSRT